MLKKCLLFFVFCSAFTNVIPYEINDNLKQSPILLAGLKKTIIKKGLKCFNSDEKLESPPPLKPSQKLFVDLRNPCYKNGILTTSEGGIIKNEDIRIQARNIQYIKRTEDGKLVHKIEAEGDLMIQYKERIFVGEELVYDFITKTGTIFEGKTFASPWFLGGEKIALNPDGSYKVKNVFLTTCENTDSAWDIHASDASVLNKDLLHAKKVRFRFFKIPALWLPSFKINLKKFFSTPIVRYKLNWDKKSGPKASLRYQLYSWKDFAFFARLDYRLKRGWGGAIETEYLPSHGRTTMVTKNYLATDSLPNDPKIKRRYRVQGAYHSISPTGKTKADILWDKFSDIHMPGDFKSDDFEIDTAKKTEVKIRHQENDLIGIFYARPRLNTFETLKQDLPTIFLTMLPKSLTRLKVISNNYSKLSYLDYAYSEKIAPNLPSLSAIRLETFHELYRSFNFNSFSFAPTIAVTGIFYNKNPYDRESQGLGSIHYGALLQTRVFKEYENKKHIILPYLNYIGFSSPTIDNDSHYIFSIKDGFHRMNLLKAGFKNLIFSRKKIKDHPDFEADLYANLFLADDKMKLVLPRLYLNLIWTLPSVEFSAKNAWNTEKQMLDHSNLHLGWTINEFAALSLEFLHRSKYDWRKADHENFILDVYRSENALLDSPLSDRRNTVLTKIFLRLSPFWSCQFESHHGFFRKHEPGYNEFKIDLFTMLSSSWKVRISYQHTQRDDRVTGAITLVKK